MLIWFAVVSVVMVAFVFRSPAIDYRTVMIGAVLPVFGALPFVFGATDARIVDAYFEAMSGLTTTGSTVITGLDNLPKGINLWRGLLQWLGGIGIIVVAMVFLPELRVGGMQIFRSEAFDTMGKILPRATAIAGQISVGHREASVPFSYMDDSGKPIIA